MPLKVKNIAAGFYDSQGRFHPIRASADYVPSMVGEERKWKQASIRKVQEAARRAAQIAAESKRRARKSAQETKQVKRRGKKAAAKKAKPAARPAARKRNPIPTGRYIDAKIMRTRKGDLKVVIPVK